MINMANNPEEKPPKKVLKASELSWMNFQPEQLIYDKEEGSLIRFRAMFEMPNWEGVEEGEITLVIENSTDRLDKIAARMWGPERQELYWVIAARNNLDLPDVQLYKGRKLKIPSKSWIDTKLLPQAQLY